MFQVCQYAIHKRCIVDAPKQCVLTPELSKKMLEEVSFTVIQLVP